VRHKVSNYDFKKPSVYSEEMFVYTSAIGGFVSVNI
jgi:hypothetical protein